MNGEKRRRGIGILLLFVYILSAKAGKVSEYTEAIRNAENKVAEFRKALISGTPEAIRKATLEIQADPAAIKALNRRSVYLRSRFVRATHEIQEHTVTEIKKRIARQYGVDPEQVRVKKFTNPRTSVRAGHDWDLSVSIRGKGEIDFREARRIVHESYFDAVGGSRTFPGETAEHFAETHKVEVTSQSNPEAYEGGKRYLKHPESHVLKDPERLARTIEYKSDKELGDAKKMEAEEARSAREVSRHEQARQYTKQYDKHIRPRVEKMGGKIPKKVREGTEILKKIGTYDRKLGRYYTPADAEQALAARGESFESIIRKGSTLVESAQKLRTRPPETPRPAAGSSVTGNSVKRTASELMVGIDILNGAGEIKRYIEGKSSGSETAKRLLDQASMGAIGTVEHAVTSNRNFREAEHNLDEARKSEWDAYSLRMAARLRKNGIPKSQTLQILRDMRRHNTHSLHRALVSLRNKGVIIPLDTPRDVGSVTPDKTLTERSLDTGKHMVVGLKDSVVNAGKFVVGTVRDSAELTRMSTQIIAENRQKNLQNSQSQRQMRKLRERLVRGGISPEVADAALERFRQGHPESLRRLRDRIKHPASATTERKKDARELREEIRQQIRQKPPAPPSPRNRTAPSTPYETNSPREIGNAPASSHSTRAVSPSEWSGHYFLHVQKNDSIDLFGSTTPFKYEISFHLYVYQQGERIKGVVKYLNDDHILETILTFHGTVRNHRARVTVLGEEEGPSSATARLLDSGNLSVLYEGEHYVFRRTGP